MERWFVLLTAVGFTLTGTEFPVEGPAMPVRFTAPMEDSAAMPVPHTGTRVWDRAGSEYRMADLSAAGVGWGRADRPL